MMGRAPHKRTLERDNAEDYRLVHEALKKVNPNTKLYPDPAFQLDKKELPLPKVFEEGNTVGINVSPLIIPKTFYYFHNPVP